MGRQSAQVKFSSHNTASPKKRLEEGTFTLTKERSSGQNIFDTSKKTVLKQPDGTTTERVVKQTFANIRVRGKRKNCDDSEAGLRKQAKLVDDILEHTSRHDKSTKARLLAKIIDRNGSVVGTEIKMKSKAIQQTLKLTPEQTASLMADNESDYRLKKFRTVFINGNGYSLIAI